MEKDLLEGSINIDWFVGIINLVSFPRSLPKNFNIFELILTSFFIGLKEFPMTFWGDPLIVILIFRASLFLDVLGPISGNWPCPKDSSLLMQIAVWLFGSSLLILSLLLKWMAFKNLFYPTWNINHTIHKVYKIDKFLWISKRIWNSLHYIYISDKNRYYISGEVRSIHFLLLVKYKVTKLGSYFNDILNLQIYNDWGSFLSFVDPSESLYFFSVKFRPKIILFTLG